PRAPGPRTLPRTAGGTPGARAAGRRRAAGRAGQRQAATHPREAHGDHGPLPHARLTAGARCSAGRAADRRETTLETSRSRFRARAMARGRASLERDVVVHVVEVVRGLARRRRPRSRSRCGAARPGRSACRLSLAREAAVVATTAPVARAEQLHRLGDDLGGVAVLPFLVLPLARLQTTFDVDRPALPQVFTGDFGEAVVEDDRVPLGFLALLARGAVFPVARGGEDRKS